MVEAMAGLTWGLVIWIIILVLSMLIAPIFAKDKKLAVFLAALTVVCMGMMWCFTYMSQMYPLVQPIKKD
ncbi:v-type proton atpase subunit [Anaeramoeba flamelloides]|uniref:V-type proton atpase subunit n=1 Tax=Anaeramoeba flamelloides TaxID=1746091 RepID=A0AAV7YL29_9EUKA|nr:v-type proton atpase subunit [Anaeramoeba flamelloides]KAJ3429394.1 v-type proton atpase subunit [Anaeramoeba flamelloides]KAJ3449923.1 v-type proton atpase subunit [Anaeramoeba flamelloides]KAJ6228914.1 v-type proton atpase subunit [Anaeramoeba flamelloides]KAJ6247287.1 v-type proton atpase subunit [Anaeramoeba flamelloides]